MNKFNWMKKNNERVESLFLISEESNGKNLGEIFKRMNNSGEMNDSHHTIMASCFEEMKNIFIEGFTRICDMSTGFKNDTIMNFEAIISKLFNDMAENFMTIENGIIEIKSIIINWLESINTNVLNNYN
jgi:hypothetical protein